MTSRTLILWSVMVMHSFCWVCAILHAAASQLNILLSINRTTENKCTFQWLDIDLMSFLKRMSMILSVQYTVTETGFTSGHVE